MTIKFEFCLMTLFETWKNHLHFLNIINAEGAIVFVWVRGRGVDLFNKDTNCIWTSLYNKNT